MDQESLLKLVSMEMPYGKYQGRLLADLPADVPGAEAAVVRAAVALARQDTIGCAGELAAAAKLAQRAGTERGAGLGPAVLPEQHERRDGRADLVIGTNEQLGHEDRWGLVHLLKGSAPGVTTTGSKSYSVTSLKLSYTRLGGPFAR